MKQIICDSCSKTIPEGTETALTAHLEVYKRSSSKWEGIWKKWMSKDKSYIQLYQAKHVCKKCMKNTKEVSININLEVENT